MLRYKNSSNVGKDFYENLGSHGVEYKDGFFGTLRSVVRQKFTDIRKCSYCLRHQGDIGGSENF